MEGKEEEEERRYWVYVALGEKVEQEKLNLNWCIHHFTGLHIVILHVISVTHHTMELDRNIKREKSMELINQYLGLCQAEEVKADYLVIEATNVEFTILNAIVQENIRNLVMGGSVDEEKNMWTSKIASVVSQKALPTCRMWFIDQGIHLYTRPPTLVVKTRARKHQASSEVKGELQSSSLGTSTEALEKEVQKKITVCLKQAEQCCIYWKNVEFQELRWKQHATRTSLSALYRERVAEIALPDEQKRRKGADSAFQKHKTELEKITRSFEDNKEKRDAMLEEKESLNQKLQDLQKQFTGTQTLLQEAQLSLAESQSKRSEMLRQRNSALRKAKNLQTVSTIQHFIEFSTSELVEATHSFNQHMRIHEGELWSVYRGEIRYNVVAIKLLKDTSLTLEEFHEQVRFFSKIRHRHLLTPIGICTESRAIVYNYLQNGSLADQLDREKQTVMLMWPDRLRIAAEICSGLLYLHSIGVIHGLLDPSNILLDHNLSVKLANFGLSDTMRSLTLVNGVVNGYLDPYFIETGNFTSRSDIYSLGIVLLQLLTGRSPEGKYNLVRKDIVDGKLQEGRVDPSAGEWPLVSAFSFAELGLQCCRRLSSLRPKIIDVIAAMPERKDLRQISVKKRKNQSQDPPPYFICPIYQEVMHDPHVAADGFTYDGEAIRGWFKGGHMTSPMTNLTLVNTNLTPNRALKSAIEEWQTERK